MWRYWTIGLSALAILLSAGDALAKKKDKPAPEQEKVQQQEAQVGPMRGCCCRVNCPLLTAAKPAAAQEQTQKADVKAPAAIAPGRGFGPGRGAGGPRAGRGPMPQVMATFHRLLDEHEKIERSVKDVDGGVVTVTTSSDPEVTKLIRTHVGQMKELIENRRPIRMWDPLFVKLFENADKIEMKIEEVKGGVKVTQTSEEEEVVKLIRQHAKRGVSEFVKRGWDRAPEETPLPK
jgi:uncharacterized protein YdcH (DUF465 family)